MSATHGHERASQGMWACGARPWKRLPRPQERAEHQGQGVGGRIVESLVEQVERIGPPKSFIGLFAAGRAAALYERLGFAAHPGMTGMFRVVQEPSVARG